MFVERVWYGEDGAAAIGRALLAPAAWLFGAATGVRDVLYDAGWLPVHDTAIPAVSIGNLTVGGTGKTPVSAWVARELAARGARPAVLLRGYGDDEPLVHRVLNPDIPVFTGADRVATTAAAAAQGATIAVLDDAFQHRRARRAADIVLVSADRWTVHRRLLPAGPWREPLTGLRRATLIVVTRKAAEDAVVDAVHARLAAVAPAVPRVSVRLMPADLVRADAPTVRQSIDALAGARVHAILSIADPDAFVRQLEQAGATVIASVFADHHTFSDADVAQAAALGPVGGLIVCTLKDAVKLESRWPRLAPPLWYVSQQVKVERGVGGLERLLDDLVRPRS